VEIFPEPELRARALALPGVAGLLDRLGDPGSDRIALVGGAVRDLLLGERVFDVDLAVEGPVEPVLARLGASARLHGRFGTAGVQIDGAVVDLARTRRERYARPGALPDVEPASLEEDLARRDFTVNAMAVVLRGVGEGELFGAADARQDLEARRLRVLHPGSFSDDPTRLLRLARYRARLGFDVEPGTRELAEDAIAGSALGTVSGARVGNELRLLSAEDDPVAGWQALGELGLGAAIEAGFGLSPGDLDVARRALALLPAEGRSDVILLALALHGVAAERRAELMDRLAMPARLRDDVLAVVLRAPSVAEDLRRADRPSEIAGAAGPKAIPELVALAGALGAEEPAREWLDRLRQVRLAIDGDDLRAAGVRPGPALGAGLAAARAALLDGRASTREDQLAEALRVAQDAG
jgi:tRNA nucleotidyltransferase (CCA-adding enzyme)